MKVVLHAWFERPLHGAIGGIGHTIPGGLGGNEDDDEYLVAHVNTLDDADEKSETLLVPAIASDPLKNLIHFHDLQVQDDFLA